MILFLTNADTELLALRTALEALPPGFPRIGARRVGLSSAAPSLEGVDAVLIRLLGGRNAWEGFGRLRDACRAARVPLLAFGGEAHLDAELAAASSVGVDRVSKAFEYLVHGGPANIEQLLRFIADEVCGQHFGYQPAVPVPDHGVFCQVPPSPGSTKAPRVAVLFYRAHLVAGNTRFVEELCRALADAGVEAIGVYCYSLRPAVRGARPPVVELLRELEVSVVITTVLAAGGFDGVAEAWEPGELASLDVPVIQAVCSTGPQERWAASAQGMAPIDVAMAVAIPEFDGRIISVPFSFKEQVDDGDDLGVAVSAYRTAVDRTQRVAKTAAAMAKLRDLRPAERRVALVLSAYPTRRSRLGNAVGLDTPASVIELLHAMRAQGYRVEGIPDSADALMATLADGFSYDTGTLAAGGSEAGRWSAARYAEWFQSLPDRARSEIAEAWGPPPTEELVFPGMDLGGVLVAIQPPRGFGDNPVAVYHSPDLPPTHQYLAFYRWLEESWGAHAIVHMGKHGTLEWLPGKSVGLSASCAPDMALGNLPLVYPFVVNDPGEGTQAKRRAHAVIVDHLVPPLTRAETYDALARLEELLDQHAQVASLDPAKLPAIRQRVWETLVAAEIHRDLGWAGVTDEPPQHFDDPTFDDLLVEVDGYLCELKDAQIRGGLHVLGRAPTEEAELDLVAAIMRSPQGAVPSLREEVAGALGLEPTARLRRAELDRVEAELRQRLARCQRVGWDLEAAGSGGVPLTPAMRWVCERLVPALRATTGEIDSVLRALDGRFVPPGPSGAPTRGMAHVLPTGRNFYSIDPRSIPSPLAWEVGQALAARMLERHLAEEGRYPTSVGLVAWGTSAMRTGGDDVAEMLALIGVRPVWSKNQRVEGVELIDLEELGRPRVEVTLRMSGFFRDAFPHVLRLLDEAVRLAASAADEPPELNPLAAAGPEEPRVFGPKPGAYGSGILEVISSGAWDDDADLGALYLARSAWAYGADGVGVPASEALARRLAAVEVAVKNQDNREHDIFDSDDYLQDHGGMVAAIRSLRGRAPKAWFGDSADPQRPKVRSLAEEAARVVRSRVLNPKWLMAMERHGYKGAFEMAATVDYLFGYDATAGILEDWMYERVTQTYVGDPERRKFFARSNPWALRAIAERLLEAADRGLWRASPAALETLRAAVLEAEGWEESR